MVTPLKGDYGSVPLTAEGKRVADSWQPQQAGRCEAYGVGAGMRAPGRLQMTWEEYTDKPIHFIVNTQGDEDHTGGNEAMAKAGPTRPERNPLTNGLGGDAGGATSIIAHENVLARMSAATSGPDARSRESWPTDTYFEDQNDLFFNQEAVQVLHQPHAHADGDSIVFFKRSDVIVAGDLYSTTITRC